MDTYIGMDLAWTERNDSGVAVLREGREGLDVIDLGLVRGMTATLEWLDGHLASGDRVVVMVDAPLVVRNETGGRPCERVMAKAFGANHAGPYFSNRRLLGARQQGEIPRGEALGEALGSRGFVWPPQSIEETSSARIVHECYPHPAHIRLFNLARTLTYKKKQGRQWPAVREAFGGYVAHMRALKEPKIAWTRGLEERFDVSEARGVAYKRAEDQLDALC